MGITELKVFNWIAALVLGPGVMLVFLWFLKDLRGLIRVLTQDSSRENTTTVSVAESE